MPSPLPIVSQFTPYTCAQACLESFLQQLGIRATQADMLTHHRRLCFNPPPDYHTFGAIDPQRFAVLAQQYLLGVADFPSRDTADITAQLDNPREMLTAICGQFRGQQVTHAIRLSHLDGNTLHFMCPGFPIGSLDSAPFADFRDIWQPTIIRVFAQ